MKSRGLLVKIDFPFDTPDDAIEEMMLDLRSDLNLAAEDSILNTDDPQNTHVTITEVK